MEDAGPRPGSVDLLVCTTCRSAALDRYFGESDPQPCGVCDRCTFDAQAIRAWIRNAVPESGIDATVLIGKASPLDRDALIEELRALREEPRRAAALAAAAQRFTTAFLAPERVIGYVAALVRGYATLQRFRPRRHPMAKEWADAETMVSRPTAAATTDATLHSASFGHASGVPFSVALHTGGSNSGHFCPPADVSCCKRHPRACRRRRGTR
jgi:hypothetical protein